MLPAANTIFFRVHTRVLLTLGVAVSVVVLCLTNSVRHPAPSMPVQVTQAPATQPALPLKETRATLPRTAVRLFFLLPHLVVRDK